MPSGLNCQRLLLAVLFGQAPLLVAGVSCTVARPASRSQSWITQSAYSSATVLPSGLPRQWTASGSSNSALWVSYQARVSAGEARSARVCSATYFSASNRSRVSSESCSGLSPARARCSPQEVPLLRVSSASASVARWISASLTVIPAFFARCTTIARSISASSTARASLGTSCGKTFASPSSPPLRIRSSSIWTRVTGMAAPFTTAAERGGAAAGEAARLQPCATTKRPSAIVAHRPPR